MLYPNGAGISSVRRQESEKARRGQYRAGHGRRGDTQTLVELRQIDDDRRAQKKVQRNGR